jgi:hypothetical protein
MSEDRVVQALRALSEHDASREASPEVEARLRVQFQSRRRRSAWRRTAVWAAAAAAMVRKTARRVRGPVTGPQEVVTDFFPLMDPAPPFERGQLLRVELPASAMQMVGLPVREDRLADSVQADVLVGEEGLPRAIRFVSFELK